MARNSLPPVYGPGGVWPPLVTTFTEAEMLTIDGHRFYFEYVFNYAAGQTIYIKFQAPPAASKFFAALQNRTFKSRNGGADIEILWNSTGVVEGDVIPTFNENRFSSNVSKSAVNIVTVSGDGTVRETDFLNPSGTGEGANSSGDVSPELGYRIYKPDSFFIAKVTNTHNAVNRIKLSYSWVEPTLDRLIGDKGE